MDNLLTVKNYKLPLKEIEKDLGHGYYGTLQQTADGKLIQCHLCGELFENLGSHVIQKHQVPTRQYKIRFQLQMGTALISDTEREKRKEGMQRFLNRMSNEQRIDFFEKLQISVKERTKNSRYKHNFNHNLSLEYKNKKGLCPDQILNKIHLLRQKLNRVPKIREFEKEYGINHRHVVIITFGSWNKALLKLDPNIKVTPNYSKKRYSNEELLERLRKFKAEMSRFPTHEDCRRGLLPSSYTYYHRFGGLIKARQLAGIIINDEE